MKTTGHTKKVDVDVSDFSAMQQQHAPPWAVDPLLVGAHAARYARCDMAAALLANDQACVGPLRRMQVGCSGLGVGA